jgi:Fic family protein
VDINALEQKKGFVNAHMNLLPQAVQLNYNDSFKVEYTHNSTAIEGNTLTLMETKLLLDDKISVGDKNMREIYEVVNHNKAFEYVIGRIKKGAPLDENAVKDIHAILMENIQQGGIYRNVDVFISGAQHTPPSPVEAYQQVKQFYQSLNEPFPNAIEKAAYTHAEFVRIHPFTDGNGRTSRLIMNYVLMEARYLPISIAKEQRLSYFEALESYSLHKDLSDFIDLIAELEGKRLDFYYEQIQKIMSK